MSADISLSGFVTSKFQCWNWPKRVEDWSGSMFHYGKAAKPRAAVDAYLSAGHLMVEGQTRTLQASQQMDAL